MRSDAMTDALLMGAVLILSLLLAGTCINAALRMIREERFVRAAAILLVLCVLAYVFGEPLTWAAKGLSCLAEVRAIGYCVQF